MMPETSSDNKMDLNIDPMKYISSLPEFSGKGNELFTFVELVDQIILLVSKYNANSQAILLFKIKSKLNGRAREIIEINSHLKTWSEIKKNLIDNFGDKRSSLHIFNELRSVTFTSNCIGFYNQITSILRRLHNKVKDEPDSNNLIKANIQTGLKIFKDKLPEPMRSVLFSRNPETLEEALDILVEGNYAYYSSFKKNSFKSKNYGKNINQRPCPPYNYNKKSNSHHKPTNQNQYHSNTPTLQYNHNFRNSGQLRFNRSQNFRQNNQFNSHNNNRPEPMDVDSSINSRVHFLEAHNEVENFHSTASENKTYLI